MDLKYLFEKLEVIEQRLDNMNETLIRQEENIAHHIRRSDNLEQYLQIIENEMKTETKEVLSKIAPLQKHVDMVNGGLKLIGIISILIGCGVGIVQMIEFFTR